MLVNAVVAVDGRWMMLIFRRLVMLGVIVGVVLTKSTNLFRRRDASRYIVAGVNGYRPRGRLINLIVLSTLGYVFYVVGEL